MTDQYRDQETAIPAATDLPDSIRGLQAVVSRKENEKQAALAAQAEAEADAAAARQELAEARALLGSVPEPRIDPNHPPNPRKSYAPLDDPLADLRNASWADFGIEDPRRR